MSEPECGAIGSYSEGCIDKVIWWLIGDRIIQLTT